MAVHVSSRLSDLDPSPLKTPRILSDPRFEYVETVSKPRIALVRGNSILALPLDVPLPVWLI